MVTFQIAYVDNFYRVYRTTNGLDKAYVGPRFLTPSEANEYADRLANTPRVTPLRSPAESSSPVIEVSAGDPRGSSPAKRTGG